MRDEERVPRAPALRKEPLDQVEIRPGLVEVDDDEDVRSTPKRKGRAGDGLLQLLANKKTLMIKDEAFAKIKELILKNGETSEYEIQKFICDRLV